MVTIVVPAVIAATAGTRPVGLPLLLELLLIVVCAAPGGNRRGRQ